MEKIIYDIYKINELGQITNIKTGRILKTFETRGYDKVGLRINNYTKKFFIHRLVAQAFLENYEGKSQVNHIDGNKKNNCLANLEWNTSKENLYHSKNVTMYGRVISRKKILELSDSCNTCTVEEFTKILINNCI